MVIEHWTLPADLQLFGNRVRHFPEKVKEGFDELVATLPEGLGRHYYGLSWMEGTQVIYYAMAVAQYPGEGDEYMTEYQVQVKNGGYYIIRIRDWMDQTACIKDAFGLLMPDTRVATGAVCIEWYQSDQTMWCMMKAAY